jgi:hypothetical protein
VDCFVSKNGEMRAAAVYLQNMNKEKHAKGFQDKEEKRILNKEKKRIRDENRKRKLENDQVPKFIFIYQ